jgi:predicted ABC-class ATPase
MHAAPDKNDFVSFRQDAQNDDVVYSQRVLVSLYPTSAKETLAASVSCFALKSGIVPPWLLAIEETTVGEAVGAYFKNKYGGHGVGRGSQDRSDGTNEDTRSRSSTGGGTFRDLLALLARIDGRQYPSYHDLETSIDVCGTGWLHPMGFTLQIGRAQSDPFAPPTRCRLICPQSVTRISSDIGKHCKLRGVAAADFVLRRLYATCRRMGADHSLRGQNPVVGGGWSGPKGGDVQIMQPTQYVLEQSAVHIDQQGNLVIHLTVNLPARGRTILGQEAARILDSVMTQLIDDSILGMDHTALLEHVDSIDDQAFVQGQLEPAGLVAFVRNGAVLARKSGVDDGPMMDNPIPFQSPPSLEHQFQLPTTGKVIAGMGIRKGVTLICGGGFHGKSTLLKALQMGIYYKIPGDGREFCVTDPMAVKIRAEDGRSIRLVDISPFIKNLPFGKDTIRFTTEDASGSTSQASNIVEVSDR